MKALIALGIALLFLPGTLAAQSEKHVNVPGTAIWLIPPAGFVLANSFAGFQDTASSVTITVAEVPGPFEETSEQLYLDCFKKGVKSVESTPYPDRKGRLIKAYQEGQKSSSIRYLFITGDACRTVTVTSALPAISSALEPIVQEAVLSTIRLEKRPIKVQEKEK